MESKHLSLQEAFDSTFHRNPDFDNFLNLKIEDEYQNIHFNDQNRNIISPSKTLRKYHKFINSFIFDFADINQNVAYGYRHGKNAYDAVVKHANSNFFFQADIKNYFSSISTDDVKSILNNNISKSPINDLTKYESHILNLVTVDNKLPIGFSTSPNISNTFLYGFDNLLEKYSLENGLIYTRYADDLILSSDNKENINHIQGAITTELKKLFDDRIKLNNKKTKITRKGNKIKILGMVVLPSGKVSVDIKLKKELEVLLHFYITDKDKFNDYLQATYDNKLSVISGKLNYINTIDKSYLNKLRKKYGNYLIDAFCHQSIK